MPGGCLVVPSITIVLETTSFNLCTCFSGHDTTKTRTLGGLSIATPLRQQGNSISVIQLLSRHATRPAQNFSIKVTSDQIPARSPCNSRSIHGVSFETRSHGPDTGFLLSIHRTKFDFSRTCNRRLTKYVLPSRTLLRLDSGANAANPY